MLGTIVRQPGRLPNRSQPPPTCQTLPTARVGHRGLSGRQLPGVMPQVVGDEALDEPIGVVVGLVQAQLQRLPRAPRRILQGPRMQFPFFDGLMMGVLGGLMAVGLLAAALFMRRPVEAPAPTAH